MDYVTISTDGSDDQSKMFGAAMNVGQAVEYGDIPATDAAMDKMFERLLAGDSPLEAAAAAREVV